VHRDVPPLFTFIIRGRSFTFYSFLKSESGDVSSPFVFKKGVMKTKSGDVPLFCFLKAISLKNELGRVPSIFVFWNNLSGKGDYLAE